MKHLKYLFYVLRHKWYVFIKCCKRGIIWQGLVHDLSKFSPKEWFAYVENFYGKNAKIKRDKTGYYKPDNVSPEFDKAWLHHIHNNPHHWQYWVIPKDDGTLKTLPIPDKYIKEMVCDFWGAGKAQGTPDILKWYEANKEKLILHPQSRKKLEQELGYRTDDARCVNCKYYYIKDEWCIKYAKVSRPFSVCGNYWYKEWDK